MCKRVGDEAVLAERSEERVNLYSLVQLKHFSGFL